jgi:hypothetical protein
MDVRIPRQNHLGLLDDAVGMPQTAKFQSTSRPVDLERLMCVGRTDATL